MLNLIIIVKLQRNANCGQNVAENGACVVAPPVGMFQERSIGPFDIQDIFSSLLSPSGISNQFTDILTFQSIVALGWFLAGNGITHV